MRGAISWDRLSLILALVALILGVSAYLGGIKVQIQQASPVGGGAEVSEMVPVKVWDLMVSVYNADDNTAVTDANIYLLYKKPSNIYVVPSTGIYRSATHVNESYTFSSIKTGRTYFVLVEANGFYNGGDSVTLPTKILKTQADLGQPYTKEIYLDPKGTILGVQVPLTYRGSSADIAKLVYNSDNDYYETEFSFVAGNDGVVKYKKLVIDLNTDNLGTATIDSLKVTVGEKDFEFDSVAGSKSIKFDTEQVIGKGETLSIKMVVTGTGLDGVSGELFKVKLYDVQDGNWMATVEGPA